MQRSFKIGDEKTNRKSSSYKKLTGTEEGELEFPESPWLDWSWIQTKNGFYFTWLIALVLVSTTAVVLDGVLWNMRGGTFQCMASPLLSGQVKIADEKLSVYEIVNMAATSMEFESALIGTRLEKCVDFCKHSFNIGEYYCNNEVCSVCHVSAFDSFSSDSPDPFELCVESCECCMEKKCSGSCKSFVSNHACGFECPKFGYADPASCT